MQPQQQGGQEMPNENVGPRMAVTVDGEVLFFDEKGNEIKDLKK